MALGILFFLSAFPVMYYISMWKGLGIILLLTTYMIVRPWYWMLYYRNQGIPYLSKNPLILESGWFIRHCDRISSSFDRGFSRVEGPWFFVTLVHPKLIKEFLQTKEHHFEKHHPFFPLLRQCFGNGLIFSVGKIWKSERRIANKAFSHQNMVQMAGIIEDRCNIKIKEWKTKIQENDGNSIDLDWSKEACNLTLDVIGVCAFGQECQNFHVDGGNACSITDLTRAMGEDIVKYGASPAFILCPRKLRQKFHGPSRELHEKSKLMKSIGRDLIQKRIQELKRKPSLLKEKRDLLNLMLEAHLEDREVTDVDHLVDIDLLVGECVTFIVAGSDTTSGLLSWFFYNMTLFPEVLEKVRNEVKRVFGEKFDSNPNDIITFDALDQLPYMSKAINETLRIYPSVPRIAGRVAKEDVMIGDVKIKKGTIVAANPYLVHRSGFYWEDPKSFDPDRKEYQKDDLRYMPFSAGRRNCIGQFFALMEAKIAISKILLELDIECDKTANERVATTLTLYAKGGIPATVSLRK